MLLINVKIGSGYFNQIFKQNDQTMLIINLTRSMPKDNLMVRTSGTLRTPTYSIKTITTTQTKFLAPKKRRLGLKEGP